MKLKHFLSGTPALHAFLCLCLAAFGAAQVQAEESLLPPQQIIKETSDKLQQELKSKEMKGDFAQAKRFVEKVIDPHVDFNRVSALVLGKNWKRASPDQRERFRKEFRELLIRTYAAAFTEYSSWSIRYLPLRMKPDDRKVIVKTQILQPGARPVAVNYRMINKKGGWKVYDIIIEGISLVTNYRTTFKNEVAKTGSLDSVIQRLAERNTAAIKTNRTES